MKTTNVSLDYVMAIVSQGANASRDEDLREAKDGIEKHAATRKEVKAKLKDIKASDKALNEMEAGNTGFFKRFVDDVIGGFLGFRNEAKHVREGRAENAQIRKGAEQLDVEAEEEISALQNNVRDVSQSFDDSNTVLQGIQQQVAQVNEAAFSIE